MDASIRAEIENCARTGHPQAAGSHFCQCSHVMYDDEPNCPLKTGLRPCMCEGLPRCPVCNYTKHDAAFEGDHDRCRGRIPEPGA